MPLSPIILSAGRSKTNIDENELYNPEGIVIHYGYDGRAVYGDEPGYAYSAITQTPGLHNIKLSRTLAPGEKITLHWRNGYDLIIYNPGSEEYVEIEEPSQEELPTYYEKNEETGSYFLTQDTVIDPNKTYYKFIIPKTRVKKRVGGSYQEIGKWLSSDGNSENTYPLFKDDVLTKRFDYIETKNFREF